MRFILTLILAVSLIGCGNKHTQAVSDDQIMAVYHKLIVANNLPELKEVIIESKDQTINASVQYADNTITLNQGMLDVIQNEDEMAMVIGHELAHRTMGHSADVYNAELKADKLGLEYAVKAGYDKCKAAQQLWHLEGGGDHPYPEVRYAATGCPK